MEEFELSPLEQKLLNLAKNQKLVMLEEFAAKVADTPKRLVQLALYSLVEDKLLFRHSTPEGTTYHLQPVGGAETPSLITEKTRDSDGDEMETIIPAIYAGLETKILAAIDAKKRTLPQIKEHAGIERKDDISEVIAGMIVEHKIRKCENEVVTAFFRYGEKPRRWWLTGERTVEAEFDETFVPRDEQKKAEEMAAWSQYDDPDNEKQQASKKGHKGRKRLEIDLIRLEELAATLTSQAAVANALTVSDSLLGLRLKEPAIREAYEKGKARNPLFTKLRKEELEAPEPEVMHEGEMKPLSEAMANYDPHAQTEPTNWLNPLDDRLDDRLDGSEPDASHETYIFRDGQPQRLNTLPAESVDAEPEDLTETIDAAKPVKHNHSRRPIEHTNEQIEEAAFQHSSFKAIAESLGYKQPCNLRVKLEKYPEMLEAFERGIARRPNAPSIEEGRLMPEFAATIDLGRVEELAFRGKSVGLIAEALGVKFGTLQWHTQGRGQNKLIKEAWERGLKRREEFFADAPPRPVEDMKPPFEGEMERFVEAAPEQPYRSSIVMEVGPEHFPAPQTLQTRQLGGKTIVLANGGNISVGYDANFFDMTPAERDVLAKIAAVLDEANSSKN